MSLAQSSNADIHEFISKHTLIRQSQNLLQNDSCLYEWYAQLNDLETKKTGIISIVHIGDSHIQAGSMTAPLREGLQARFGNAGRGLIFPYQVAKTNGPNDYTSFSEVSWLSKRNAYNSNNLATGLAGHSIYSNDSTGTLTFSFAPSQSINSPELTVVHESSLDSNYRYHVRDANGKDYPPQLDTSDTRHTVSRFQLNGYHDRLTIKTVKENERQRSSLIYAFVMKNGQQGVLHHTIGVNGAEYRTYFNSEKFTPQISLLDPSLFIIAMGTNEAYNTKDFNQDSVRFYVHSLIDRLQAECPKAKFIISILPETLKEQTVNGKTYYKLNPNVVIVRDILIKIAKEKNLAWWDLYEIFGGQNSMAYWHSAGLTDTKRVHFKSMAYQAQGVLLHDAIMRSYEKFLKK